MRVSLDQISFNEPEGYEDATNYTFSDAAKRELLTVTIGARPPEATDLQALLTLRRENLEISAASKINIEGESNAQVDGMPGRMLSFTFADRGVEFRERWAVAFPGADTYLQISYLAPTGDQKAQGRFEHILRSLGPAMPEPVVNPDPPGYVRRWAQQLTLDVPDTLAPPGTIQFVSPDGGVNLGFHYFDTKIPAARRRLLEHKTLETQESQASDDREVEMIEARAGSIQYVSYTLKSPYEPELSAVRRASLTIGNAQVQAFVRGPATAATQLDQVFRQWINTFELLH
jgi:hypothetical protein